MKPSELTAKITMWAVGSIETLLGLRFVSRLFNADSGLLFFNWLYDMTAPVLEPFHNVFGQARVEDGFVFELTTLMAMASFAFLGYVIMAVVGVWKNKADSGASERKFSVTLRDRR